jgi:hypothetical protein
MKERTFWLLHDTLSPYLTLRHSAKKRRHGCPNGIIPSSSHVSIALQYFAGGGSPYDIQIAHGVSHTKVFRSVWRVVDAVNRCKKMEVKFPEDHAEQNHIAQGFKACSPQAKFSNCVGTIDGILIWIEKPQQTGCNLVPRNSFAVKRKSLGSTCKLSVMRKAVIWIFPSVILAQPQITFPSLHRHLNTSLNNLGSLLLDYVCLEMRDTSIHSTWQHHLRVPVVAQKMTTIFTSLRSASGWSAHLVCSCIAGEYCANL